jgi:hypothetical protein
VRWTQDEVDNSVGFKAAEAKDVAYVVEITGLELDHNVD